MDSFPRKTLPPALSQQLTDALQEGETFSLAPWVRALLAPNTEAGPLPFPGPDERALALATIWSEAKYNFAFWDRLPGEAWWGGKFREFLPLVQAAATEQEYWDVLARFARLLGDGQTGVHLPHHLRRVEKSPPIRVMAVEGRPIVVEGAGIPPGSEILAVDGEDVRELRTRLAVAIESSTAHYTEAAATARILRGSPGTPVKVRARRWDGTEFEVTLQRTGRVPPPPRLEVQTLGGGRLRVAVNTMGEEEVAAEFHRRFPDFAGVTGLVLDLRRNSGGSTTVAHSILARFLPAPTRSAAVRIRTYVPVIRAWGGSQRWIAAPPDEVPPDPARPSFTGPAAVLTSPFTAGAAEDFLIGFRAAARGPVIGEPSCGSTGQPLYVPLPGGGAFRVCCKRDMLPDGTDFVGRGVLPDIAAAPTIAGINGGRDDVLDAALRYLDR